MADSTPPQAVPPLPLPENARYDGVVRDLRQMPPPLPQPDPLRPMTTDNLALAGGQSSPAPGEPVAQSIPLPSLNSSTRS